MAKHWHIDVEEFRRLWESDAPAVLIARRFGITANRVYDLRKEFGCADRPSQKTKPNDPTPSQIAERAAAIRERHLAEMRALG